MDINHEKWWKMRILPRSMDIGASETRVYLPHFGIWSSNHQSTNKGTVVDHHPQKKNKKDQHGSPPKLGMWYVRTHPRMKTAPSGVDFQSAILAFDMLGKSWWPKLKGSAFLGWFPNVSQPSFAGLLVDQGEVALIYAEWWKKFQSQLPVWEYRTQLVCASTACYNPAIQAMNLSEYGAQAKIPFPQHHSERTQCEEIPKFPNFTRLYLDFKRFQQ